MDTTATRMSELTELRRRRAELRETMGALESVLSAPTAGRAVVWGERVHTALLEIADDWREHVIVTEGPGGLHESILANAVRLSHAVQLLVDEHGAVAEMIAEAVAATEAPVTDADVAAICDQCMGLLGRLVRHRQRGADLIYEAYEQDLGAGD